MSDYSVCVHLSFVLGCYLDPEIEPAKSPSGSPRASVTSVTSSGSTQSSGKDITKQK